MRKFLTLLAMMALAGCGGGGGSAGSPGPVPTDPPKLAQATLKITFPLPGTPSSSTARKPNFVSPNAQSIKILIDKYNGSTTIPSYVVPNPDVVKLDTTAGTGNCTVSTAPPGGQTETCTINNVPAPPGSVEYVFSVYASTDGTGSALASATVTENVVQGILNTFNVTLSGVVNALVLQNIANFTANTPGTENDIIRVNDPSGARIVGTAVFFNGATVTVTDADSSGQTSLADGGTTGSATNCTTNSGTGNSCTLSHGADTVKLVYTGRAAGPVTNANLVYSGVTITASTTQTGVSNQTATPTITDQAMSTDVSTLDDSAHGGQASDPNYNQPTLFFVAIGQSQGFNVSELGWSNAPYSQSFSTAFDPTTCGTGASAVATITPSSGTSFTVTSKNTGTSGSPAICKLTVSDGVGQSAVVWISVGTANFNVN